MGVTSGAGTEATSGAPLTGVTSGNPAGKTEGPPGLCCGLTLAVARLSVIMRASRVAEDHTAEMSGSSVTMK